MRLVLPAAGSVALGTKVVARIALSSTKGTIHLRHVPPRASLPLTTTAPFSLPAAVRSRSTSLSTVRSSSIANSDVGLSESRPEWPSSEHVESSHGAGAVAGMVDHRGGRCGRGRQEPSKGTGRVHDGWRKVKSNTL